MTGTSAASVIDVVDPDTGEPVSTATRSAALEAGLPIRSVHVFLFDDDGRLLLQELGRERARHASLWGSSVAGFPHPLEPEDSAARRRTAEELGRTGPLRRVGRVRTLDGTSPKFVTLYEGEAGTPEILEPGHVERIEFWSLEDLDAELARHPARFTDTFRQVYSWWREQRRP